MIRFLRNHQGTSTVEFALIAPLLVLGVLSTADLGFEISDRMEIDQALRNGAEAALEDPGVATLDAILTASQTVTTSREAISWTIARNCVCPETASLSVDCFTTCQNSQPTAIYYEIEGSRDAIRILLPGRSVSRSLSVQVR